jgi:hypothetical protein
MEIDGNRVSDACCTISEEGTITTSVWRKVGSIDLASRNACWKLLGIEREGQEMHKMQQIRSKETMTSMSSVCGTKQTTFK